MPNLILEGDSISHGGKIISGSEAGKGPLDVLELRHFTLPTRIFVTVGARVAQKLAQASPPPLPPAAITAAKHAATPLPRGFLAEVE
ncbi:hypothetical protein BJG93_30220 (plasmid) [Paraburkholderia sprentiae WSM5005]|uniref:Uncharacterized protein n=1 Tax=Paraburkholderia sprentiae WSM5005 TaxID=754502 RepID=A0A1I9YU54_9BURK|nr:hypothetical protein [Paraburkholderia sprentiae]APA89747.1 hypothetical protein BJG93_30220 [Paraburkholderia sprentiae WSM5005]